jgi:predicted RNA-binding protein with PIN domain
MPEYVIVDGYNLLHTLGSRRSLGAPGNLQRARAELAGRIAARMTEAQRNRTTIVFDANFENRDLPPSQEVQGIRVEFARDFADADSMIEHLLRKHPTPQSVVVVSNDRRVRVAAERRRARPVDCESWFDGLSTTEEVAKSAADQAGEVEPDRLAAEISPEEREYWLRLFGGSAGDG